MKPLMQGTHMHVEVIVQSTFVERVAQLIVARGYNSVDLEAVGFVFDEALSRLFSEKHGSIYLDELVVDGLFALEVELARRETAMTRQHDGGTLH